jgi:outer membrane lipoprotein-sorting protein
VSARRALALAVALTCACAAGGAHAASAAAAPARPAAPRATAALVARLARAGRVEARVSARVGEGPAARAWRGTLALEPPDRARLDLASGGERMTARGDGGEWLQPALGQLLKLGPGRVAPLLGLWDLLLGRGDVPVVERALGARRTLLVTRGGAVDSAWVTLGADGLPATLETRAGDERMTLRLSGWRFGPARGRAAFVLTAPPGVVVVPLD